MRSVNYYLMALISKDYVKAKNSKNAQNKLSYAYILTPSGINHKKGLTMAFLRRKKAEYKILKKEIAALKQGLKE